MGALYQLGLLFKKNFLLRKRQPGVLVLEVLWPLLVIIVVAVIRQSTLPDKRETCHYQQRPMPSVGVVPFVQSFACTLENKCQARDEVNASEEQGYRVAALISDVTPYLASEDTVDALEVMDTGVKVVTLLKRLADNSSTVDSLGKGMVVRNMLRDPAELRRQLTSVHKVMTPDQAEALLNASINVAEFIRLFGFVEFKSVACDPARLGQFLLFQAQANVSSVSQALCSIPDSSIPQLTQVVQNQVDVAELVRMVGLFERLKSQVAGDQDELGEAMSAVADLMDLVFRSPSLSALLTDSAALQSLPDLVRKLPGWFRSFQNAEELIKEVHTLVMELDPVMTRLGLSTSVWQSIRSGLELGAELTLWFQNSGNQNATLLLSRMQTLLSSLDNSTETLSSDFASIVSAMAKVNFTSLGQLLMGQGTLPQSTFLEWMHFLQIGLEPTSFWNMTSPLLVMADSMVEMASTLLNQFIHLEKEVVDLVLGHPGSKGALLRLLERGPNVTLAVLQAVTDPSFLASLMAQPTTFPEACGKMADKIQTQVGAEVASDIRALLCSSNVTTFVLQFANSTAMQQLQELIKETAGLLNAVLGGWQEAGGQGDLVRWRLEQGNFTSLYLHASSLVTSFTSLVNFTQATWTRLLSDGQLAATMTSREWTTVWDMMTNNFLASSSLAMVRSFSLMLADNQTAAMVAPYLHMVEIMVRGVDNMLKYYLDMYGSDSVMSRLTEMVTTYMPEVMMATRSFVSNQDVMYRLIGAADPLATFCGDALMKRVVFPGSQAVPMAELEAIICKTNWTAMFSSTPLDVTIREMTAVLDSSAAGSYDVEADLASINDHLSRMVAMMTDTDALMAAGLGPANVLQSANMSRIGEAFQYMTSALSNPSLQDLQGMTHVLWLAMEQIDRQPVPLPSWPMVQHGVLAVDAFLNYSIALLQGGSIRSLQSALDTSPWARTLVTRLADFMPGLLESLSTLMLNPEHLITSALRADQQAPDCSSHFLSGFLEADRQGALHSLELFLCQFNWTALAIDLGNSNPAVARINSMIASMQQGTLTNARVDWVGVAKRTDQYLSITANLSPPTFDWSPFNLTAINASWTDFLKAASSLSSIDPNRLMQLTTRLQQQMVTLQSQVMQMVAPQVQGVMGLYANLSLEFLTLANANLQVINWSKEWDVLGWLGSPQLTRAIRTLQLLPQLTQVGLDNVLAFITDPSKVSVWMSPDGVTQLCTNVTAFSRLLGLQNKPEVDAAGLQAGVCALNLNMTLLLEELMASVPGFRDFYNKVSVALANPDIAGTTYAVDWSRLNSASEELGALITSLTLRFPPIKDDIFSSMDWVNGSQYEQRLQHFQQQMQDVLANMSNTFATESWQSQMVTATLLGLQSVPGFPRALQYIHAVLPIIEHNIASSWLPLKETVAGYPTLTQLLQHSEQLPELLEVLAYTVLLHPEKLTAISTSVTTSWENFCSNDPASFFATPPSSTFDLRSWIAKLCDINATVFMDELNRMQGNGEMQILIEEDMGVRPMTTPPVGVEVVAGEITRFMQSVTSRMTSMTSMTTIPSPFEGLRMLNESVWAGVLQRLAGYANASATRVMSPDFLSSLLTNMTSLSPEMASVMSTVNKAMAVADVILDSMLRTTRGGTFKDMVAGYPNLERGATLLDSLPEVLETVLYTMLFSPEKISVAASAMTSFPAFCAADPTSLFTVPPAVTFDLRAWVTSLCAMDWNATMVELAHIQGTTLITELLTSNSTPAVDQAAFSAKVQRLVAQMSNLSESSLPQASFLDPARWQAMTSNVQAWLSDVSQLPLMSTERVVQLLMTMTSSLPDMQRAVSQALAFMDLSLDSTLRNLQGQSLDDFLTGAPTLQQLVKLMDQLPEIFQSLAYTALTSPQQLSGLGATMTSLEAFCTADLSQVMAIPPSLSWSPAPLQSQLCSLNLTRLLSELEDLGGSARANQIIMSNTTVEVNATALSAKVDSLVAYVSKASSASTAAPVTMTLPRFLNESVWQSALTAVQSWLTSPAQVPAMVTGGMLQALGGLLSATPALQQSQNEVNTALRIASLLIDRASLFTQGGDLGAMVAGYPTLQSLVRLMDQLPQLYQALVYTALFHPEQVATRVGSMTSWEAFCSSAPSLLATPPNSTWDSTLFFRRLCDVNTTQLTSELALIQGTTVIEELLADNSTSPVNMTSLGMSLNALVSRWTSMTPMPMMTSAFLNASLWEAANNQVARWAQSFSTMSQASIQAIVGMLGNLTSADSAQLQQVVSSLNTAAAVTEVILDKLLVVENASSVAMQDFFSQLPQFEKLLNLALSPNSIEVLLWSVDKAEMQKLFQMPNSTVGLMTFCDPRTSASQWLAAPTGSSADLEDIRRKFCEINLPALGQELTADFRVPYLLSVINGSASVNIADLSNKVNRVVAMVTRWSTSPPDFRLSPELMNATFWLNLLDAYSQARMSPAGINAQLRIFLTSMGPLLTTSPFREMGLVLRLIIQETTDNLVALQNASLTLDTLAARVPALRKLFSALGLPASALEPLLGLPVRDPDVLGELLLAPNITAMACGSDVIWRRMLVLPDGYNTSRLQEAICSDPSRLEAVLTKEFDVQGLIADLKNASVVPDWEAILTEAETLTSAVQALMTSLPTLQDQGALQRLAALYSNTTSTDQLWNYLAPLAAFQAAFQGQPGMSAYNGALQGGAVMLNWVNAILGRLLPGGGTLDLASLFRESPTFVRLTDYLLSLQPDTVTAVLSSMPRPDKVQALVEAMSNATRLRTLFCDEAVFQEYFLLPPGFNASRAVSALCQLNASALSLELQASVRVPQLIAQFNALMNGTAAPFNVSAYITAQQELTSHIMRLLNVSRVTFDGNDIAQSFYVRNTTALMTSLTNALMSLAPAGGTEADYAVIATRTLDSLLTQFLQDPNFQYVVASLNFIDLYLRNLKERLAEISARGFSLAVLLENTELGKLLPIVTDPAWLEEAANITLITTKLQELLQSPDAATRLCGPDLWSILADGPHPTLERLQTTACSLNATLTLWQTVFMRANGLQLQQQAAALMEEAARGQAILRTNTSQISADVTAVIQAVTSLMQQPGSNNLTAILGLDVNAFQNVVSRLEATFLAKLTSMSTQLSVAATTLMWPLLPHSPESQQMGRLINSYNLLMGIVNDRLQDILDRGVSWSTVFGNYTRLVSLMETALRMTQLGMDAWGPGQIDVTKARQLVADPALLNSQCQAGQAAAFLANGSSPTPLSRDLASMLCVVLDFQPIQDQLLAIWQNGTTDSADFAVYVQTIQKYVDLLSRLIASPPPVDPTFASAFNFTSIWTRLQQIGQDPSMLLKLMKAYGFVFDLVPLDSNTAMVLGATQRVLALARDYMSRFQASGLDLGRLASDPTQLLKLVDMATDTQAPMDAIRQLYVEPIFMAVGSNAWFKQQVLCKRGNLTLVLGQTPSSDLSLLCYSPPDTWYSALTQRGFSPAQLWQLAEKLAAGVPMFRECASCPPAPSMAFPTNVSFFSIVSDVEELTTMLTSLGSGVAAPGAPQMTPAQGLRTMWLAVGHLFNRSLQSANQLAGAMGWQSMVEPQTKLAERSFVQFLQFIAAAGDFVNNWLHRFTGTGATVRLSDVMPDSRRVAELLSSLLGPATAAEFLTAQVSPSMFYGLASSGQWSEVACSRQRFAATFSFPPGTDVTSLQQALCLAIRGREDSLQKLLDLLDAGTVLTQFQTLLAANYSQATLSGSLLDQVINTTATMVEGLQRLASVSVDSSDLMAWLQPILDVLMALQTQMPLQETCLSYERYVGNTAAFQSMKPTLAWMTKAQNLTSSFISLTGVMENVMCDVFGKLELSQAVRRLSQAGFWQLMEESTTPPGPFSCQALTSASVQLTEAINSTVMALVTPGPSKLATCLEQAPTTFQSVFSNLDTALKLTADITEVLQEEGLRQLLKHSEGLAPLLDFVARLLQQQQSVIVKLSEALNNSTDVTSYLTNTLRLSPEIINAFLQSTIQLDSNAFIQRPVEEIQRLLCNPTLLGNVLTLPAFSPVNVTGLSAILCDANVAQTATAIRTASDAALLVQQALMAASGLQSQAWVTNLTSHALELFRDLGSLQALSPLLSSGLDLDVIQRSIPAIDRFLQSGPARIVQGLTAIMNDITAGFPGPETQRVIREIDFFVRGILGLGVVQSRFLSAVRVSDMAKDPAALQRYLVSALNISQQDAASILSSTYSIRVFLNITETVLKENMTCKDIFGSLILMSAGSGVSKDSLTSALCSLDKDAALNLTSRLVPQLDIGDFVQQYVTSSLDEVLQSSNVTAAQVRQLGDALTRAKDSLSWASRILAPEPAPPASSAGVSSTLSPASTTPSILDEFFNMPEAQTGSAALASVQPLLCGTDQSDLTNSSSSLSLARLIGVRQATFDPEELEDLPSDFCRDLYREILSSQMGSIIWTYLKPIMRGKIVFSPDTPLSREIMSKSMAIFDILAEVKRVAGTWRDKTPSLKEIQAEVQNIDQLKTSLESDFVSAMVSSLGLDAASLVSSLDSLSTSALSPERLDSLQRAAAMVYNYTSCVELDRMVPASSEAELEAQAFRLGRSKKFLGGVVFTNLPQSQSRRKRQAQPERLPTHVVYKIRMDPDNVRTTNRLKTRLWNPSPEDDFINDMRYLRGFVQLQDMLDRAIISLQLGTNLSLPGVSLQQFPSPCHHNDNYIRVLGAYLMPVLMTFAWIATIAIATRNLLYDREQGQEETLVIMGMRPRLTWLSWMVSTMLVMTLVSLLTTIILKFSSVYRFTDFSIIFLYLLDFAFSTVMMSYMVSAFFTRATVAMLTVLIVYLLTYLPYIVVVAMEVQMTFWQKTVACLASTSAFGFSAQYLARMEEKMVGVQWNNIAESPVLGDPMTFSWACFMMLIDSAIYLLIGWYIRNVKPGKYGVGQPWYFPVSPQYWCGPCLASSGSRDPGRLASPEGALFQDPGREGRVGMAARGLRKTFRSKTVVSDLSLDFMESQITALLGHNGAAKTTTMNMLIGVLKPSGGEVSIYGKNVVASRGEIGFCPQHNALFDFMTVKEHMQFYAGVKNSLFSGSRKQEIRELLQDVDLWSVRHLPVGELSGGMKRRLCVALAFVGGSRAIVLDEPTSGVDPNARAAIWKLIARNRTGRTILLSTHHLDEADTLSDRTAVLHQGRLLALGSPHFLKERLAAGYRLTLTKALPTPENSEDPNSYVYYCNPEVVTKFIRSHVPEAELAMENATELTFTLPTQQGSAGASESGSQPQPLYFLFAKLDQNLGQLRLQGYGVTAPTLEEVFLKLTRLADRNVHLKPEVLETERRKLMDQPSSEDGDTSETSSRTEDTTLTMDQAAHAAQATPRVTGASLKLQQLGALLAKRFHHFRRDWRMLISLFLLPVLFALVGMGFATIRPTSQNMTDLLMTPAMYGPNAYAFYKDSSDSELSAKMSRQLYSEPGIGTTCMQNQSFGPPFVCVTPSSDFSEPVVVSPGAGCTCHDSVHSCDPEMARLAPPQRTTRTSDILQRLDAFDVSSYLLDTFESFTEKRYGGWTFSVPERANQTDPGVTVWFNNKGYHALPAFLNAHSNNILRSLAPSNKEQYGITLHNHPLAVSEGQLNWETIEQTAADVGIALMLLMAFSFIPAALTIYLVQEREAKEKQMQFINGVGNVLYWTAAFIWDMFIHTLAVGLVTAIIAIFRIAPYFDNLNLAAVFVLLLLFGWAVIPLMYCTLRLFNRASAAYLVLFCTNLFLGVMTVIILLVLALFMSGLGSVFDVLRYVFLIFPQYCFTQGLVEVAKNHFVGDLFRRFGEDYYRNPFSLDIIGWHLVAMAIEGLVFFLLTLFVESVRGGAIRVSPSLMGAEKEDEEVAAERQRVEQNGGGEGNVLLVKNLSKVYRRGFGRFLAVDHISFGVGSGECFGLLGVNGAGKTTTFRMMTGDTHPSSGAAFVGNTKITLGDPRVGADVGYCPQQGGLDPYLTPKELLTLAASLKGLSSDAARLAVEEQLSSLELGQHADTPIRQCSGGTQRKVALAVALLGEPRVLFLDEPTTGMDPATRRLAWRSVRKAVRRGQSVVLTSHNMDECEKLCDRIAIMVNGRLVCLGSPQHLKYRFGDGYTAQIQAVGLSDNKYTLENTLLSQFPGCAVKDKENNLLELSIPRGVTTVANVFAALEHAREQNIIQTYSVSQTTLDTVFITFARAQTDGLGDSSDFGSGESSSEGGSSSDESGKLAGPFTNATYAYSNPHFLPDDPSLSFRPHRLDTISEPDGKLSTRL